MNTYMVVKRNSCTEALPITAEFEFMKLNSGFARDILGLLTHAFDASIGYPDDFENTAIVIDQRNIREDYTNQVLVYVQEGTIDIYPLILDFMSEIVALLKTATKVGIDTEAKAVLVTNLPQPPAN